MNRFKTFAFLILFSASCFPACKKTSDGPEKGEKITSAADQIAGLYKGIGRYLPGQIDLGVYTGCVEPANWQNNFRTGTTTVNIVRVNDSTVKITLSGDPFAQLTYPEVRVTKIGGDVQLFQDNYYDSASRELSISAGTPNTAYLITNACLGGVPFFYGYSVLNDNHYSYQTIDHAEFVGTKQ